MTPQLVVALITALASPVVSLLLYRWQRRKDVEARNVAVQEAYSKMRSDLEANADYYKNELREARDELDRARDQLNQEREDRKVEIATLNGRIDQLSYQLELARGGNG